jgi:hypothetical protein
MNLLEFKDAIALPLKKAIEQHKSNSLAQFNSRDDLIKHWDRAEGMIVALNHIEATYAATTQSQQAQHALDDFVQEILPPQ